MKMKRWPNKRCVSWPSVHAHTGQVPMRGVAKWGACVQWSKVRWQKSTL